MLLLVLHLKVAICIIECYGRLRKVEVTSILLLLVLKLQRRHLGHTKICKELRKRSKPPPPPLFSFYSLYPGIFPDLQNVFTLFQESSGRLQKPISVQLKSGSTAIICVRKMSIDNPLVNVPAKRPNPTEVGNDSKKLKTEHISEASEHNYLSVDHVKEIERLKDLLSQRDEEISSLHKIVAALTRKQGI